MYSRDLIDAVLKSSDIVSVISSFIHIEKNGKNFVALCPFHDDRNPSLSISKEKQIFKCFVCGTGGDAIGFVQKFEKTSYPAAVRRVAELSNFHDPRLVEDAPKVFVDPDKQRLYNCIDDLQLLYKYALSTEEAKKARDYLAHRGITDDLVERFKIGYAPLDGKKTVEYLKAKNHSLKEIEDIGIALANGSNTSDNNAGRLIFPLFNPRGQLVGFSARQLEKDGTAKYINSPENTIFTKGNNLYNYHNVVSQAHRDGYCYVMEGFMDVMSAYQAGENNAVATMGTALTPEQVRLLGRLHCEIRLCFDGDKPGQEAAMKNSDELNKAGIPHRIVDYQGDLRDPDDIYHQDGKEGLIKRLNVLLDPIDFRLSFYQNSPESRTQAKRKEILQEFLPYLAAQKPGIEYEEALVKLSNATLFSVDAIRAIAGKTPSAPTEVVEDDYVPIKTRKRDHRIVGRLPLAEKSLLYYMLHDPRAIEIYQTRVGSFYDDTYRLAANYILDYAHNHPGENIDVSSICSSSSMDGNDEVTSSITELALEKNREPSNEDLLLRYAKTIKEEKHKQIIKNEFEANLLDGDEGKAADALQALIDQKKESIHK